MRVGRVIFVILLMIAGIPDARAADVEILPKAYDPAARWQPQESETFCRQIVLIGVVVSLTLCAVRMIGWPKAATTMLVAFCALVCVSLVYYRTHRDNAFRFEIIQAGERRLFVSPKVEGRPIYLTDAARLKPVFASLSHQERVQIKRTVEREVTFEIDMPLGTKLAFVSNPF